MPIVERALVQIEVAELYRTFLESAVQQELIDEIVTKIQPFLPLSQQPDFLAKWEFSRHSTNGKPQGIYLITSNRRSNRGINAPYYFSNEPMKSPGKLDAYGPFDPVMACALTYLFTEGSMLENNEIHSDNPLLSRDHVLSALGDGVLSIVSQVGNQAGRRKDNSLFYAVQQSVFYAIAIQIGNLKREFDSYHQFGKLRIYKDEAQDKYKKYYLQYLGIIKAIGELAELLQYRWPIISETQDQSAIIAFLNETVKNIGDTIDPVILEQRLPELAIKYDYSAPQP